MLTDRPVSVSVHHYLWQMQHLKLLSAWNLFLHKKVRIMRGFKTWKLACLMLTGSDVHNSPPRISSYKGNCLPKFIGALTCWCSTHVMSSVPFTNVLPPLQLSPYFYELDIVLPELSETLWYVTWRHIPCSSGLFPGFCKTVQLL